MKARLKKIARQVFSEKQYAQLSSLYWKFQHYSQCGTGSQQYWTDFNVTNHQQFSSAEESLYYFKWRCNQYWNYLKLMPVDGFNGKNILDFGCGPGNDLVGFACYSKPAKLYGYDVSATSLEECRRRLELHNVEVELMQGTAGNTHIPVPDQSIDLIHSSGVLHHMAEDDLMKAFSEFRRVLKPGGHIQIMVYNYDSLWLHLGAAYHWQIVLGKYSDNSVLDAFRCSTDGEACPISNCYKQQEWLTICKKAGFSGVFRGASISMHEMNLLPLRYNAILDRRLDSQHRDFLLELTFDQNGFPIYQGQHAGLDACYELRPE